MTTFYWGRAPVCPRQMHRQHDDFITSHTRVILASAFSRAASKYSHRASRNDCFPCRCTRAATTRSAAWEATATALTTLRPAASTAAGGRSAAIEMPCAALGTAAATVRPWHNTTEILTLFRCQGESELLNREGLTLVLVGAERSSLATLRLRS